MPKKGFKQSKEQIEKRVSQFRGRPAPEGRGARISLATKGLKRAPFSEEAKRHMSEVRMGDKNKAWKVGVTKEPGYRAKMQKIWYKNNPDKIKKYYQRHSRAIHLRRKAYFQSAEGGHTKGDWENLKAQYNWICPCCSKSEPVIKLTEDHIIPLSKGGSHNIENIQPLCQSCNSKKHTKIIKYDKVVPSINETATSMGGNKNI